MLGSSFADVAAMLASLRVNAAGYPFSGTSMPHDPHPKSAPYQFPLSFHPESVL
jgi:hypothetical protein